MGRGSSGRLEESPSNAIHRPGEALRRQGLPPMQGMEQLPHPFQELFAPAGDRAVGMLDQEPDIPDQTGQAKLDGDVGLPHVGAVGGKVVAPDPAAETVWTRLAR